ncbi:hypothetical protein IAT38_003596 [Cryptococcus sp. DSM 104549]
MPSYAPPGTSFLADPRPPKSPKRFFTSFSPLGSSSSHPPLPTPTTPTRNPARTRTQTHTPSSSYSSPSLPLGLTLGSGVTVVRTPQDAVAGMKQAAGLVSPPQQIPALPPLPPLPPLSSLSPHTSKMTTGTPGARYPQPTGHTASRSVDHSKSYNAQVEAQRLGVQRSTSARAELSGGLERAVGAGQGVGVGRGLLKSPSAAPVLGQAIEQRARERELERERDRLRQCNLAHPTPAPPTTPKRSPHPSTSSPYLTPPPAGPYHTYTPSPGHSSYHSRAPSGGRSRYPSGEFDESVLTHSRAGSAASAASGVSESSATSLTSGSSGSVFEKRSPAQTGRAASPDTISPAPKRPSLISHRTTVKPPPRLASLPTETPSAAVVPFSATLLACSRKPLLAAPGGISNEQQRGLTLVTMEFAYSLSEPRRNESVTLPLEALKLGGGRLLEWVEGCVRAQEEVEAREKEREKGERKVMPEMTDGESAEESDIESGYDLDALLREEYLKSMFIATPSPASHVVPLPEIPPLPLPHATTTTPSAPKSPRTPGGYKRAQTRNQYTQLLSKFPSPGSGLGLAPGSAGAGPDTGLGLGLGAGVEPIVPPLAYIAAESGNGTPPLNVRRRAPRLSLEPGYHATQSHSQSLSQTTEHTAPGPGPVLTELRIFLPRDAAPYHALAHRLLSGGWPSVSPASGEKERLLAEMMWLDMTTLGDELRGVAAPMVAPSEGRGDRASVKASERQSGGLGLREARGAAGAGTGASPGDRKSLGANARAGRWKEKAREKSLVLRGGQGYI